MDRLKADIRAHRTYNLTPKSELENMTEAWKALRDLANVTHPLLYEAARERDRLVCQKREEDNWRAAQEAVSLEHQQGLEAQKVELLARMNELAAESPEKKIRELVKLIDEYETNKSDPKSSISGSQAYQAERQLWEILRKI